MAIWENSLAEIYYTDGSAPELHRRYKVRIDDGEIVVSYESSGNNRGDWVSYKGKENSPGHFTLTANHMSGSLATLHMTIDGQYLEGYWSQASSTGMWRIRLLK